MNITAYTLNITYGDTTRPITYVENCIFNSLHNSSVVGLTLYTFKDLIPDYQRYYNMTIPFNIKKDKEAQLTLPPLEFKFSVETLGHGTLDIVIDNPYSNNSCHVSEIKEEIQKQIGIAIECIQLCDSEGLELSNIQISSSTLFAIFNDYKDQVIEQGYDIIEYKSVFKQGRMMRLTYEKKIGNYQIVKFSAYMYTIGKRTPKMIVFDSERNTKKKIAICSNIGEYVTDCYISCLVAWDESITYGKEYAIAC